MSQNKTGIFKKASLFFIAFLVLLVSFAAAFYWFIETSFDKPRASSSALSIQNGDVDKINYPNKVNILLLGVDERDGDVGRSDTICVIMLDTETKQVSLLSVPRDTRMSIPGYGWDKVNHAYAHDGIQLSKRTLEGFLGIPLDYYATINFDGFCKIIDTLGGVTINVEERMYYEDPYDNLVINLKPGLQTLGGRSAIHYVRYRDEEGDIGRVARQQKFMKATFEKAFSPRILTALPSLVFDLNSVIKTNMSTSEIIGLAKFLNNASISGLGTEIVHGAPAFIDEVNYWIPDVMELRNYIAKVQNMKSNQKWLAASKALAEKYNDSIPARTVFDEKPSWMTSSFYAKFDDTADNGTTEETKKVNKSNQPDGKATQPNETKTQTDKTKQTSKSKQPPKPRSSTSAKNAADNKSAAPAKDVANSSNASKKSTANTSTLRVNIINASGVQSAAGKIASVMRREGFEVTKIAQSSDLNSNTVVITNNNDNSLLERLADLPFRYSLKIDGNAAQSDIITIVVGQDYLN